MKNKKILILTICIILIGIVTSVFFIKNNYKFSKTGNNISNKSADEIKEYILNMESYEATAKITIKSNNTTIFDGKCVILTAESVVLNKNIIKKAIYINKKF